jgi:poly(3-hydroxybutyrate) depolymerase
MKTTIALLATQILGSGCTPGNDKAEPAQQGQDTARPQSPESEDSAIPEDSPTPEDSGIATDSAESTQDSAAPTLPWDDAIEESTEPASERLVPNPLGSTTAGQGFYAYTPPGYPSDVQWPLIIALHGGGENGPGDGSDALSLLLNNGISQLLNDDDWPNDRPFVVLMPQHDGPGVPSADEVHTFISWALDNYPIATDHVALVAHSMGAYGAWEYLSIHRDTQISSFVPIAGSGILAWNSVGCGLAAVPIWAFHGDADEQVSVHGTIVPMDHLSACPAPPAMENQYTIYAGVAHNSWTQTYDGSAGHDIFSWVLDTVDP